VQKKKEELVSGYRSAQQTRSALTEAKFLKAAAKLFAERGYSGTRVADIIRESGCSTGSFYHRFSDKESVFHLLLEYYIDEMMAQVEAYDLEPQHYDSVEDLFHFFTEESVRSVKDKRGFYMAVQELSLTDSSLMERLKRITQALLDRFEDVTPKYLDQINAENPHEAMKQACQLIVTLSWRRELGDGVYFPKSDQEFARMMANAASGILNAAWKGKK